MAETFHLSVQTPERTVFDDAVVSLVAPGGAGYLGVLAHHAPLITDLVPGKLSLRDTSGSERVFAISGGFMEVSRNHATILADTLESPEEVDLERAKEARDRAIERLKDTSGRWDEERARLALLRALNRMRIKTGGF
ncbi:MAG: ATP synthase F1 subunit epsilon [Candidatus Eisenbacteria bacterium]|uniref:ATP synthase epsilon chain n=1 Tax=Eiseniibacteriota bacterium TaxID=2212470 RepID=A0A948RX01_UNCEI|nr:ATP synthase F1 subunit epsilon [Candidatus Eisenbacteria bacterium]MBU1949986.1 ATP synthase F1 subunit epsilon [Candidatus Eisenbacteria bacterium]MBU2691097.1 ATP synthase F1 subunit epsilon [Candidatus Eisenbacteria bacterium]